MLMANFVIILSFEEIPSARFFAGCSLTALLLCLRRKCERRTERLVCFMRLPQNIFVYYITLNLSIHPHSPHHHFSPSLSTSTSIRRFLHNSTIPFRHHLAKFHSSPFCLRLVAMKNDSVLYNLCANLFTFFFPRPGTCERAHESL